MDDAAAVFDAAERLVYGNAAFSALFPDPAPQVGDQFDTVFLRLHDRRTLSRRKALVTVSTPPGQDAAKPSHVPATHLGPPISDTHLKILCSDGESRIVRDGRMPDGGILSRLRPSRANDDVLTIFLEAANEGIMIFDGGDRLVQSNPLVNRMLPGASGAFGRGRSFEQVMTDVVAAGAVPAAAGNQAAWVALALSRHREPRGYWEYENARNRWIRVTERPTRSGGMVCVLTDVTEFRKAAEQVRSREQRLIGVLDTVADGIVVMSSRGLITSFNRAAEQIFGWTAAEVLGQSIKMLMPVHHARVHDKYVSHYEATGENKIIGIGRREQAMRKDGTEFPIHLAISEMTLDGERAYTGVIRDLSDLVEAEEAIRLNEERYALAQRATHEAIVDWDVERDEISYSERITEIVGVAPARIRRSVDWVAMIHPEDIDRYINALRDLLKGEVDFMNVEYRLADWLPRGRRWVRHRATVLRRNNGWAYRMAGSIGDVTERMQTLEDLKEAKDHAELANRAKTEFLANMSHELRTPLNAIIGYSEVIHGEMFGPVGAPQYLDYAKTVIDAGRHLLDMINDILDMSRIEGGTIAFQPDDLDFADVMASVSRMAQRRADDQNVRFVVDVPDQFPDMQGEARRLKQSLMNLLDNAIKFTPAGSAVHFTVRNTADGHHVVCMVEDEGIGMDPAMVSHILEPFAQADSKLARSYDGAGLGLPLAKAFVDLHKGLLSVDTAPDHGTRVRVQLPTKLGLAAGLGGLKAQELEPDTSAFDVDLTGALSDHALAVSNRPAKPVSARKQAPRMDAGLEAPALDLESEAGE